VISRRAVRSPRAERAEHETKQLRLGDRVPDVGATRSAEPGGVIVLRRHGIGHCVRELGEGDLGHGLEQRSPIVEVTVDSSRIH
jgi:hypothetical protein